MCCRGTLWARIVQNVKKPPLRVNVINFEVFDFNVSIWVSWSPLGPKSHDTLVELFRFTRYLERNKVHFAPFLRFLMSGPLVDKQQKTGEYVENIIVSLDTQLNFMFSTYSPLFCCLSTRGPDGSHPSLRFIYIFGDPGLLCAAQPPGRH